MSACAANSNAMTSSPTTIRPRAKVERIETLLGARTHRRDVDPIDDDAKVFLRFSLRVQHDGDQTLGDDGYPSFDFVVGDFVQTPDNAQHPVGNVGLAHGNECA